MTANEAAAEKRLTLVDALKDFGWFPLTFAVVVGGPSVLALFQTIFVEHRLLDGLQWIVDGYNRFVGVIGALLEPLMRPVIDWINQRFHWSLHLEPHWKPLFVLAMVMVTSLARTVWRDGVHGLAVAHALGGGVAALLGSAIAGLFPLEGHWWLQGLAAAVPTAFVFLSFCVAAGLNSEDWLYVGFAGAIAFILGAALSFAPSLSAGAGVLAIALLIVFAGVGMLTLGLRDSDRSYARFGLTVLGGFVTAALVVAADFTVKALGG